MLDECLKYLEQSKRIGLTYEIIVVSDGSTDKTVQVAHSYAKKYNNVRVLALVKNRGKGGAVRLVSFICFNLCQLFYFEAYLNITFFLAGHAKCQR